MDKDERLNKYINERMYEENIQLKFNYRLMMFCCWVLIASDLAIWIMK